GQVLLPTGQCLAEQVLPVRQTGVNLRVVLLRLDPEDVGGGDHLDLARGAGVGDRVESGIVEVGGAGGRRCCNLARGKEGYSIEGGFQSGRVDGLVQVVAGAGGKRGQGVFFGGGDNDHPGVGGQLGNEFTAEATRHAEVE